LDTALRSGVLWLWILPCLIVVKQVRAALLRAANLGRANANEGVTVRDPAQAADQAPSPNARARLIRQVAWFSAAPALAIAVLMAQNVARFGSPFDMGYATMQVHVMLAERLHTYGLFSMHFLPQNFGALFIDRPTLAGPWNDTVMPWLRLLIRPTSLIAALATPANQRGYPFPVEFSPWGNAIWSVSPALLLALRPPQEGLARLWASAWLAILPIAALDLLYFNTGWTQFGYRFSLDYTPFLLVLVLLGLRSPLGVVWRTLWWLLLGASVVMNLIGSRWVMGAPPY